MVQLELELDWDEPRMVALDEGLNHLAEHWQPDLRDKLRHAAELVQDKAWFTSPKRTERLTDSIGVRVNEIESYGAVGVATLPPPYGNAIAFAPYAAAVIEGARRHAIFAKGRVKSGKRRGRLRVSGEGKQALWWVGAAHPIGRVRHPGNPANPFLATALDLASLEVRDLFMDAARELLDEARV